MSELSGEFDAEQFSVFDVPPQGPKDYELIIARTSPDVDSQFDAVPITPSEGRRRGMPPAEPVYEQAPPRPDVGPVADHYAELFHAVLRDYMDHQPDRDTPAAAKPDDYQQLLDELDGFVSDQGGGRQQQGVRVELAGLDPHELRAARRFMAEFPDTTEWPED